MTENNGIGKKLKREVACLQCGTIQHADNEFCEKCRVNLFKTVGCDQCTYGPVNRENPKKCSIENVKGRCMKFNQQNLDEIRRLNEEKARVQAEQDKTLLNK